MWCSASITSVDKITNQTWKFVVQPNEKFDFIPGQFIQLKVRDIIRSYSIASYDPINSFFELLIVKLDGGVMTKLLFEDIIVGEKIEIKGPIGRFTLPDNMDRDIFLICSGTGLAPFRSFLHFIDKNNISSKKIFLVFGTRTSQDLLCLDEISELEKKLENLKFIPVLSREQWDGKMGYVHNQYLDIIKNTKLNNPIFYLCGWRDMIKEARTNLKELGYDSKSIKVEIYG
jgi:CDP-4-dehydro-6-deoxyglucose reductase